jgi:hypothetical protein
MQFAERLKPVLGDIQSRGLSLGRMAAELTAQGIETPRGVNWTACAVRNVLLRIGA